MTELIANGPAALVRAMSEGDLPNGDVRFGHQPTPRPVRIMSVITPKADVGGTEWRMTTRPIMLVQPPPQVLLNGSSNLLVRGARSGHRVMQGNKGLQRRIIGNGGLAHFASPLLTASLHAGEPPPGLASVGALLSHSPP